MELAQSKVVDQIEKYQKLNEKTTAERESLLAQITEAGSSKTEMQNHVTQLENYAKEVTRNSCQVKIDAATLGSVQQIPPNHFNQIYCL